MRTISLGRLIKVSIWACLLACLATGNAGNAAADSEDNLTGRLTGFQEVPSILGDGRGAFSATLDASSLTFTLNYSNLTSKPMSALIHFAQRGANGGIVVIFCGLGKPVCPAGTSGTLTGTVIAADVLGVSSQGVTAGSFADFMRILRSGNAYVNVHTVNFPAGEIRAQILPVED